MPPLCQLWVLEWRVLLFVSKIWENKNREICLGIKESVRLAEYGNGCPWDKFSILFPTYYLSLFTNDIEIINMGVNGLRIVGALQFLDAIGFVLMFALIGAGNTVFPAVLESVLTWGVVVFERIFLAWF